MHTYINGRRIRIDPSRTLGKGSEADVYDIGSGKAAKIFKTASHADFHGDPGEQANAKARIKEHQAKLPAFPKGLPARVITPIDLATSKRGNQIAGYTMRLIPGADPLRAFSEKQFRLTVDPARIVKIFLDLHKTVGAIHARGVVIGDFNDLNVLIRDAEAYIIDADSFQYGKWFARMYTERYMDPLLADPNQSHLTLHKPHNENSDWYAFTTMLMYCLLCVGPFGGVYKPRDKKKRVKHPERPLRRITLFDDEVRYPKPALPLHSIPDDLLQHFYQVFKKDARGSFPEHLIKNLDWKTCTHCDLVHARLTCPACAGTPATAVKETVTVIGNVTNNRFFRTSGHIVFATVQNGKLRWIYHENNALKREDGRRVTTGSFEPKMRYRISGNKTILGRNGILVSLKSGRPPERKAIGSFRNLPIFDANGEHTFFTRGHQLRKADDFGEVYIGDILEGQTLIWTGETFGFGLYRAGTMNVAFMFTKGARSLNDSINLPKIPGQLIDITCSFSHTHCWLFVTYKHAGKILNRCTVIKQNGSVIASAETHSKDGTWLGTIRGKCAIGPMLLAATDDGIVRMDINSSSITKAKEFPKTAPFVTTESALFPAPGGIYVVNHKDISLLKLA